MTPELARSVLKFLARTNLQAFEIDEFLMVRNAMIQEAQVVAPSPLPATNVSIPEQRQTSFRTAPLSQTTQVDVGVGASEYGPNFHDRKGHQEDTA